jgi:hypothetical protein
MGNDWINIAGLQLPDGTLIPQGLYTVVSGDGVNAVLELNNNFLILKDKGSVARFDENTLLNSAPDTYNIANGNFTGDISLDEYPNLRLTFTNNQLTNVTC